MRKTLWCRYYAVSLALIFSCAMVVSGVAAEHPTAPAAKSSTLEVAYNHETKLFTIHARQTPLDEVLQEISKTVHLTIDSLQEELLRERISVETESLPLEQALKKLLEGFNSVVLYSSATDIHLQTSTPRLVKVFLLSKKADVSADVSVEAYTTKEESITERQLGIDPNPIASQRVPAISVNTTLSNLVGLIVNLREEGEEIELTEMLLPRVRDPDPEIQRLALTSLIASPDPRVTQILADLVHNDSDLGTRHMAAYGLAQRGDVEGLVALSQALNDPDPVVRSMFLHVLGTIGERALPGLAMAVHDADPQVSATAQKIL